MSNKDSIFSPFTKKSPLERTLEAIFFVFFLCLNIFVN